MKKILHGIIIILILSGCSTTGNKRTSFSVSVSSFSRAGEESKKSFVILPTEGVSADTDLQFLEFSTYVERALIGRGFQKAVDINSAEVAIFLAYGIGDPETNTYTYNLPIWGQTGVASSTTTGNVMVTGNTGTVTTRTTNTPQYGIKGYIPQEKTVTTYTRHVFLTAYDLDTFRENQTAKVLWETRIASVGSSGDLRLVFPIMIAAGRPYIGVSTGKVVELNLHDDDVSVLEVKGLLMPSENTIK